MAFRPRNVVSHVVLGSSDGSREEKTSGKLWAHKHESIYRRRRLQRRGPSTPLLLDRQNDTSNA